MIDFGFLEREGTMFKHITVLLHETVDASSIKPDGIYVSCTLGGAGHSQYLLSQLTTGHLYCFDQDIQAIDAGILAKESKKESDIYSRELPSIKRKNLET